MTITQDTQLCVNLAFVENTKNKSQIHVIGISEAGHYSDAVVNHGQITEIVKKENDC